jgi:hypothetical protein
MSVTYHLFAKQEELNEILGKLNAACRKLVASLVLPARISLTTSAYTDVAIYSKVHQVLNGHTFRILKDLYREVFMY